MNGSGHTQLKCDQKWERGEVEVDGEVIGYSLYVVDARTEIERAQNVQNRTMGGNLNVYVPGHGQRPTGAPNLIATIAARSSSKLLWSIDIDPPANGDPAKAEALIKIIRTKAHEEYFGGTREDLTLPPSLKVTIFGWSHGASEAMRAAEKDPNLFQHVVDLCPTGLIERPAFEIAWSFILECLRIFWRALLSPDVSVAKVLAVGFDILAGIVCDLLRSGSLQRVLEDILWASRKVTSKEYEYNGLVVILFGLRDTVIRWQDVFPECADPGDVERFLDEYRRLNFPRVCSLQVQVLEGNHIAPETDASLYVATAFDLLD